jgi:hypothetical protein
MKVTNDVRVQRQAEKDGPWMDVLYCSEVHAQSATHVGPDGDEVLVGVAFRVMDQATWTEVPIVEAS